jgi:hypothetical protein
MDHVQILNSQRLLRKWRIRQRLDLHAHPHSGVLRYAISKYCTEIT